MTQESHAHIHTGGGSRGANGEFVIGYHVGPFGRFARLIFAVYFLVFFVVNPLVLNSQSLDEFLPFAMETLAWVAGLAAIYVVAFYFLGELLLSKMNPWTGTMFFLGLPTAIGMMGYMPQPMQVAFGIYVDFSLILIFFMRYGGCEVVALPSLIMGKRYTMYCPYNAMDAVEAGVTPDKGSQMESWLALLSLSITLFVGSWFLFIERSHLLSRYGVDWHIDQNWALLLLIPAAYVAWRGFLAWRQSGNLRDRRLIKYALGSLILVLYVTVFLGIFPGQPLWLGAMAMGGLYVLFEIFQFATGRKAFGSN